MTPLKGFQKKYLRGLSHGGRPLVLIGKEGITEGIIRATDEGLARHELIKVKFNDFKEKEQKEAITAEITGKTDSELVGMIGHTAMIYRQQPDPEKRKVQFPEKSSKLQSRPAPDRKIRRRNPPIT